MKSLHVIWQSSLGGEWKMYLQEEIGPPELGDGCISITLIDSMLDWS